MAGRPVLSYNTWEIQRFSSLTEDIYYHKLFHPGEDTTGQINPSGNEPTTFPKNSSNKTEQTNVYQTNLASSIISTLPTSDQEQLIERYLQMRQSAAQSSPSSRHNRPFHHSMAHAAIVNNDPELYALAQPLTPDIRSQSNDPKPLETFQNLITSLSNQFQNEFRSLPGNYTNDQLATDLWWVLTPDRWYIRPISYFLQSFYFQNILNHKFVPPQEDPYYDHDDEKCHYTGLKDLMFKPSVKYTCLEAILLSGNVYALNVVQKLGDRYDKFIKEEEEKLVEKGNKEEKETSFKNSMSDVGAGVGEKVKEQNLIDLNQKLIETYEAFTETEKTTAQINIFHACIREYRLNGHPDDPTYVKPLRAEIDFSSVFLTFLQKTCKNDVSLFTNPEIWTKPLRGEMRKVYPPTIHALRGNSWQIAKMLIDYCGCELPLELPDPDYWFWDIESYQDSQRNQREEMEQWDMDEGLEVDDTPPELNCPDFNSNPVSLFHSTLEMVVRQEKDSVRYEEMFNFIYSLPGAKNLFQKLKENNQKLRQLTHIAVGRSIIDLNNDLSTDNPDHFGSTGGKKLNSQKSTDMNDDDRDGDDDQQLEVCLEEEIHKHPFISAIHNDYIEDPIAFFNRGVGTNTAPQPRSSPIKPFHSDLVPPPSLLDTPNELHPLNDLFICAFLAGNWVALEILWDHGFRFPTFDIPLDELSYRSTMGSDSFSNRYYTPTLLWLIRKAGEYGPNALGSVRQLDFNHFFTNTLRTPVVQRHWYYLDHDYTPGMSIFYLENIITEYSGSSRSDLIPLLEVGIQNEIVLKNLKNLKNSCNSDNSCIQNGNKNGEDTQSQQKLRYTIPPINFSVRHDKVSFSDEDGQTDFREQFLPNFITPIIIAIEIDSYPDEPIDYGLKNTESIIQGIIQNILNDDFDPPSHTIPDVSTTADTCIDSTNPSTSKNGNNVINFSKQKSQMDQNYCVQDLFAPLDSFAVQVRINKYGTDQDTNDHDLDEDDDDTDEDAE